jgi:hypothetical protein
MEFELRKRKISLNSIRLISSLHRPYEKQIFEFNELASSTTLFCFLFIISNDDLMIFNSRFLEFLYVPVAPKQIIENFIGFFLFPIHFDKKKLKKINVSWKVFQYQKAGIRTHEILKLHIFPINKQSQLTNIRLKCNINE